MAQADSGSAARSSRAAEPLYIRLGVGFIAGCILVVAATALIGWLTSRQESANAVLQTEIARLDGQAGQIQMIRKEIARLQEKESAVADLQGDRNRPVELLEFLAQQLPEGMRLTSIRQEERQTTFVGESESNDRVSELLRALEQVAWISKVELLESKSVQFQIGSATHRMFEFSIRVTAKSAASEAAARGKSNG